jgi:hypothetical protein
MGRESEWRELGQRYGRPGVHGRDQPPQRHCTSGDSRRVGLNPHRVQNEVSQRSALALSVE